VIFNAENAERRRKPQINTEKKEEINTEKNLAADNAD
jgi:hypothetical protein